MASVYAIQNSTMATTAAPVSQPTGTAIRTMLQIECGASQPLTVIEWGISFDGSAAATPIKVELFETSVAATMSTASVSGDVTELNGDAIVGATTITFGGTTHTAFATAAVTEGTVANYRMFDLQLIAPTNQYVHQWPLGREPVVQPAKFVRVRVTAGATVNAYIWVAWVE